MSAARQYVFALAAAAAGAVAILFFLLAATLPFQLQEQALEDRAYYQQFRQAAAYAERYASLNKGRIPDDVLQGPGDRSDAKGIWASLSLHGSNCGADFRHEPADRFTLSFWRGEWHECFAHPSGKTSLPMSLMGYLRGGLGWQWAVWWFVGMAAAYAACMFLRMGQRRRACR
jgi:hypothetical protein